MTERRDWSSGFSRVPRNEIGREFGAVVVALHIMYIGAHDQKRTNPIDISCLLLARAVTFAAPSVDVRRGGNSRALLDDSVLLRMKSAGGGTMLLVYPETTAEESDDESSLLDSASSSITGGRLTGSTITGDVGKGVSTISAGIVVEARLSTTIDGLGTLLAIYNIIKHSVSSAIQHGPAQVNGNHQQQ
jgi:hypothetical protein